MPIASRTAKSPVAVTKAMSAATDQDDSLKGSAGNDLIDGLAGNDSIDGGAGDDTLLGNAGNDRLTDLSGRNLLDGGGGDDYLYVYAASATLEGGAGRDTLYGTCYSGLTSADFKAIYSLDGGADADLVRFFHSGTSRDSDWVEATLEGGSGNDTVSLLDSAANTLGIRTAVLQGGGGDDRVLATRGRELTLFGGKGNDFLSVGSDLSDLASPRTQKALLNGGDGNDTLSATCVEAATLSGGAGSDTFVLTRLQFLAQTDHWFGGARVVKPLEITDFKPGAGGDVLDVTELLTAAAVGFEGSNPFAGGYLKLVKSGVDVLVQFDADGASGNAHALVTLAVLKGLNPARFTSANFHPAFALNGTTTPGQQLQGTDLAETLVGGGGNDTLLGGGGNDQLDGNAGDDSLAGGDGEDTLTGNYGNDTLRGEAGNDQLIDDLGDSLLDGGDGADLLKASSATGAHTLLGGTGQDTLSGAGRSLLLDGGEDADELTAGNLNGEGAATLIGGGGNDHLFVQSHDTVWLRGDDGDDMLQIYLARNATVEGGAGRDTLDVGGAVATHFQLDGGADDDLINLNCAWGNDRTDATLIGGSGNDKINLAGGSTVQIPKALLSGGDGDDSLSAGIGLDLTLDGGSGNDLLSLGHGDPGNGGLLMQKAVLLGGEGNDTLSATDVRAATLSGGAGTDTFVLTARQFQTQLNAAAGGAAAAVRAVTISDFKSGTSGDVLDVMDLLGNVAVGFDGSNPFVGGYFKLVKSGGDTLVQFDADGSSANAYVLATVAVLQGVNPAKLVAANFYPGYAPSGVAIPGRKLQGTDQADTLSGSGGDDAIRGGRGNDRLDGNAGNDTVMGGDGDDMLTGSFGNDTLRGEAGNDQLSDDLGNNLLDGGDGADALSARSLAGAHTLLGGAGNDTLSGAGREVLLNGGTDNDRLSVGGWVLSNGSNQRIQQGSATLIGGSGHDYLDADRVDIVQLRGDAGDDWLNARSWNATLEGGAGQDTLYGHYESAAGDVSGIARWRLDGGAGDDDIYFYGPWVGDNGTLDATLNGGSGNDFMRLDFSDYLHPRQALLSGGSGDDTLEGGGAWSLTLSGGTGVDRFVLTNEQYLLQLPSVGAKAAKPVEITDFKAGAGGDVLDVLFLVDRWVPYFNGSNPFTDGYFKLVQSGADTLVRFDASGGTLARSSVTVATLRDVDAHALVTGNFGWGQQAGIGMATAHGALDLFVF